MNNEAYAYASDWGADFAAEVLEMAIFDLASEVYRDEVIAWCRATGSTFELVIEAAGYTKEQFETLIDLSHEDLVTLLKASRKLAKVRRKMVIK